jgi:gliding motility-associated-like protein
MYFRFITLFLLFVSANNLYSQCISCTSIDSINSGLVWCHNFTGNVIDATGHGYNGSYNGTTYVNDRFGNINSAVAFNGSSNCYIEIGQNLSDMTSFSISFWVKQNGTTIAGGLIWEGDNTCGKDNYVDMGNQQITSSKQNSTLASATVNLSVPSTGWVHFVWTASPTQSKIYKNGVLVNTINLSASWVGNHHTPTYGCWNDGNGGVCGFPKSYFYVGLLDDVRLYNRVLSPAEAFSLYNLNSQTVNINAGPNKSICLGDTVQISPSASTGATFLWSPNISINNINIISPKVYPVSNQTYIVKATLGNCISYDTIDVLVTNIISNAGSDKYLCKGNSVLLDGFETLGATYLWSPNTNISNINIAKPTVFPLVDQTYFLKTSLNGCSKTDSVTVFVSRSFSFAGEDKSICFGDSIQLNGRYLGSSFAWINSSAIKDTSIINPWVKPISNEEFVLTVVSDFGCILYDTVKITVINNIQCDAGNDILKCLKDTVVLNGKSNSTIAYWSPNNFIEDSTKLTTKTWTPTAISYVLNCSIGASCYAFDTVKIILKKEPKIILDSVITICENADFQLNLNFTNANWFLWFPSVGVSNISVSNPVFKLNKPTKYIVSIKDSIENCQVNAQVLINTSKPIANFVASPLFGKVPFNVNTINKSIGAKKSIWTFEGTKTDTNYSNITYLYSDTGRTNIVLIVFDSIGCSDTVSKEILSYDGGNLFIPNVFTPNNDEFNNLFEPVYNKFFFVKLNMQIYNRWGQQLYEANLPNGKWWDGNFNNDFCPDGVYFYLLNTTNIIGEQKQYHGTVTLLR